MEVIVMPNAAIEGRTVKESAFRSVFDAAVVGMRRGGKRLSGKLGNITIEAGDNMMLAVGPDFNERKNLDKNFVVIDDKVVEARTTPLQNYLSGTDSLENCADADLRARLCIMDGDRTAAERLTRYVLDRGYFDADFVVFCRRYATCDLP